MHHVTSLQEKDLLLQSSTTPKGDDESSDTHAQSSLTTEGSCSVLLAPPLAQYCFFNSDCMYSI